MKEPKPNKVEPLWDVSDCAKFLKIHEDTVREIVRQGEIPHFRLSGRTRGDIRFVPELLMKWAIDESLENFDPGKKSLGL